MHISQGVKWSCTITAAKQENALSPGTLSQSWHRKGGGGVLKGLTEASKEGADGEVKGMRDNVGGVTK